MKKIKTTTILILILIFGLILRLIFFLGFEGSDDLGYYQLAYKVTQNKFEHSGIFHSTRLGLIYPTAFFYVLFGVNEFSSNLLPLITSLLSIILSFYIGRLLFDDKTGLMAAFLLSFYPVNVLYSTVLYPNLPSAFFSALSIYFFLVADKKKSKVTHLFSGILIGVAYLINELSVMTFLFFAVYILYKIIFQKKSLKKEYIFLIAGFLIIFSLEMMYYVLQNKSPLFRIVKAESQSSAFVAKHFYNYLGLKLWLRLFAHYPYVILIDVHARYFYILFFVSMIYFIFKKKKESYALLFWIMPLLLFLNFGSNSFTKYIPLPATIRYLEIVTMPNIVLLAYFLNQKQLTNKKILVPSVVGILLLLSISSMYFSEKRASTTNLREAKIYLESKPEKVIYTDARTTEILRYLFNYQKDEFIIPFNNYESVNFTITENTALDMRNIHDAYVIIDENRIKNLLSNYKEMKFPLEIYSVPKAWSLKKEFRIEKNRISIYYIP